MPGTNICYKFKTVILIYNSNCAPYYKLHIITEDICIFFFFSPAEIHSKCYRAEDLCKMSNPSLS